MLWLITKYAVTALLIVVISEVAKRSDRLGSLVAALPTVTVLTLIWLYVEKQPPEKISNHAWYTFLVCASDVTNVFSFSASLPAFWVLDSVIVQLPADRRFVCDACLGIKQVWDHALVKF
jgi:hypothetical protein